MYLCEDRLRVTTFLIDNLPVIKKKGIIFTMGTNEVGSLTESHPVINEANSGLTLKLPLTCNAHIYWLGYDSDNRIPLTVDCISLGVITNCPVNSPDFEYSLVSDLASELPRIGLGIGVVYTDEDFAFIPFVVNADPRYNVHRFGEYYNGKKRRRVLDSRNIQLNTVNSITHSEVLVIEDGYGNPLHIIIVNPVSAVANNAINEYGEVKQNLHDRVLIINWVSWEFLFEEYEKAIYDFNNPNKKRKPLSVEHQLRINLDRNSNLSKLRLLSDIVHHYIKG